MVLRSRIKGKEPLFASLREISEDGQVQWKTRETFGAIGIFKFLLDKALETIYTNPAARTLAYPLNFYYLEEAFSPVNFPE